MENFAVCSSKNSEQVVKFIELTIKKLSEYCSIKYAKTIIVAYENGSLWGLHFTKSNKIRAIFI
jgi:hypothetical protein